jgi:hypothetical protein
MRFNRYLIGFQAFEARLFVGAHDRYQDLIEVNNIV